MHEESVTIPSAGLKLSGTVRVPDGMKPGEKRGAFLVLHGFGSNKSSGNVQGPSKILNDLGYVTLGFDMRGCGKSEGEFGRLICLEQVEDTSSALTFLQNHPAVHPERIAVIGSSFGGAVSVYAGGVDERVAAVISNGGWGDGERKFRGQHRSPEEWARFTKILSDGTRASRQDRQVADGLALRRRADPGASAHQRGAGLGAGGAGRDRAEHVRFPRRRRGRQDRAAAAAADPRVERFRHAHRTVGRAVQARPASRPSCTCSAMPTTSCSRTAMCGCGA